jgi:hypothetical protein
VALPRGAKPETERDGLILTAGAEGILIRMSE